VQNNRISIAKNKKARYDYQLADEFTAGLVLKGTEIKSIRNNKARITEAFCTFEGKDLVVRNMYIEEYSHGNINNHEPKRDRVLLLNQSEVKKIRKKLKDTGVTCVPTLLFIEENGKAKLQIAIASGKRLYDKRDDLKKKDQQRQIDRDSRY